MTCTDPAIPADESNLVLRAARLFFAETGRPVPDLRFELEKHIPSQAGLGGGSSNAAAVLLALRLFRAPGMPDEMLERMGAKLGSDVPFFIRGGTRRCTGRGERPQRLPRCGGAGSSSSSLRRALPPRRCTAVWTGCRRSRPVPTA